MKIRPTSLSAAEDPVPLDRILDPYPQEGGPPVPEILPEGTQGKDGDDGRHDHEPEVQRPAEPAEELVEPERQYVEDGVHTLLRFRPRGSGVPLGQTSPTRIRNLGQSSRRSCAFPDTGFAFSDKRLAIGVQFAQHQ